jgi:hypothetical protein
MAASLARRYWCMYRSDIAGNHTEGNGKPTRKRCAFCGGQLVTDTGLWGIFHWADYNAKASDYSRDKALAIYTREATARKAADDAYAASPDSDLVVRWIPAREEAEAA